MTHPMTTDPVLLNEAMNLCLEFGEHWRQPIVGRLLKTHPELDQPAAEALDRSVRGIRDWAHKLIASCMLEGTPTEVDTRQQILDTCPWLDAKTMERLWSQGCYYVMKQ